MSENTKIEWADHTFNPWIGCTKVSPGCANCYAEAYDKRWSGGHWGKGAPRKRTSEANWRKPLQWNKAVAGCHTSPRRPVRDFGAFGWIPNRPRVFCASLADWLDDEVPIEWLADLLSLIHRTPNLDWLLLTKRPQNFALRMISAIGLRGKWEAENLVEQWMLGRSPANVWIGTTVEDQQRADERIPALLRIPAKVRFLSCEPLLGPVDLKLDTEDGLLGPIHWVIAGGESGPNARPMHPDWARSLRDQCAAAGAAFFFKQWGEYLPICFDPPGWKPTANGFDWHTGKKSVVLQLDGSIRNAFPEGAMTCIKMGKSRAGRQLDGREHNEFPK